MKEYHVLNGDSLKEQLEELSGEKIVIRECLVEGDTRGDSLDEFFANRIDFFKKSYDVEEAEYKAKSLVEIMRIQSIDSDATINLWFENDLFCQVNLWFTLSVINKLEKSNKIFLVSPIGNSWKGFGGMDYDGLLKSYAGRKELSSHNHKVFNKLWKAYQVSNWEDLRHHAVLLNGFVSQIKEVVEAHIERFPMNERIGRPQHVIQKIQRTLDNPTFGEIFQAFSREAGIYGFGDTQVKRIIEEMN